MAVDRRRPRLLPSVAFMLVVLVAVAISAVVGVKGGALLGVLILVGMVAGSLAISARS